MKDFSAEEIAAYEDRSIIVRSLVWCQPKDRDTGELQDVGFSTVTGSNALEVRDGLTQEVVTRNFTSRGALVGIGDIAAAADLSIRQVTVTLSQLNSDVENALRGYDMRGAPIQIYRALFSKANPRALVAPARCRFVGFVNTAPIVTPAKGGQAVATLNCVSIARQLTNTNSELRSDESQQRRQSGDRFFRWVGATGQVPISWGTNKSN